MFSILTRLFPAGIVANLGLYCIKEGISMTWDELQSLFEKESSNINEDVIAPYLEHLSSLKVQSRKGRVNATSKFDKKTSR